MREIKFGRLAGLEISTMPSAFVGASALWLVLSGIAIGLLHLPIGDALIGALSAVALQFISEMAHQFGHVRAARRTGYPMIGIRYWGVLSTSLYPTNEPPLPAAIHIRRVLGGAPISALVAFVGALILIAMNIAGASGMLWWLALFFFLDNLLVFAIGSFLPLGFTDGSTLLYWRNKK